jgi:hypothetical protein
VFVHLGHRRGKLLVESGYENQSSEGEVVGHGDEQKNAANNMATTLPNQPVSEVPTAGRQRSSDRSRRASRRRHHHLAAGLISRVFMNHVLFGRAMDFS